MVGFAFGFAFLLIVLLQWMTALATIKKSHHISGMIGTEPNGNCGCLIVICLFCYFYGVLFKEALRYRRLASTSFRGQRKGIERLIRSDDCSGNAKARLVVTSRLRDLYAQLVCCLLRGCLRSVEFAFMSLFNKTVFA